MICEKCDEYGAVDGGDVSDSDCTTAVMRVCDACNGTKQPKCVYCGTPADVLDGEDYICNECLKSEQAETNEDAGL
jgi:hypothetical protein